ncbi:MAG: prolipoprotein diacylglyceryl transferase [Lachnospiraceae bacterium]|nr:prolipoprotein diacylglyceryl transferase [Lachnospiraceae bacterium]
MDILFSIGGIQFHIYSVMGLIGVMFGGLWLLFICKKKKFSLADEIYVYTLMGLFALAGAKLLYLLVEAGNIVRLLSERPQEWPGILSAYLKGGFVFYGGLFGGIAGILLSVKLFKLDGKEQLDLFAPTLALIHGFMRIGCALVGCCYGKACEGPLSVHYSHSAYAPKDVGLIPIQHIECVFVFALFVVLAVLTFKDGCKGKLIHIYLLAYAPARFIFEFMRGDSARGSFLGLSTSQWIGIIIPVTEITLRIVRKSPRSVDKDGLRS